MSALVACTYTLPSLDRQVQYETQLFRRSGHQISRGDYDLLALDGVVTPSMLCSHPGTVSERKRAVSVWVSVWIRRTWIATCHYAGTGTASGWYVHHSEDGFGLSHACSVTINLANGSHDH